MRNSTVLALLVACSDNAAYDPPPPEAVARCTLVTNRGTVTHHNALWFDGASRLVQIDAASISTRLEYDDEDRVVRTSSSLESTAYTYEPGRITMASSAMGEWTYDLDDNGRVTHYEGPDNLAPSERFKGDYAYDGAGNITAYSGVSRWSEVGGPVMLSSFVYEFTYDASGRIATSKWGDREQVSYAYTESPGYLTIDVRHGLDQTVWSYALDDLGRVAHAGVGSNQRGYSYAYADDTITAIPDDSAGTTVTLEGAPCPAIPTALAVDKPLTFDPLAKHASRQAVWVPNPPIDAFAGYGL